MIVAPHDILPQDLARLAVERYVTRAGTVAPPDHPADVLAQHSGVFVTLREICGALRGCIGTIEPAFPNVAGEIIQNAINAATKDPRFPEVSERELPNLVYGVDVLSAPERVAGLADLDPLRFGVIIEAQDGRRGLLLPRIDGIETVEQQWRAVHNKARVEPGAAVRIMRFTVRRFGKD
jgi:AmmeMemoRadiSam system protein A